MRTQPGDTALDLPKIRPCKGPLFTEQMRSENFLIPCIERWRNA